MILNWDKPKQVMSRTEYESLVADSAPPGVYQPNMSKADMYSWRGKLIGGKNPRAEIRKTLSGPDPTSSRDYGCHARMLIIVFPNGLLRWSTNGPMLLQAEDWCALQQAVTEALEMLNSER